jgi:hypothetical protein
MTTTTTVHDETADCSETAPAYFEAAPAPAPETAPAPVFDEPPPVFDEPPPAPNEPAPAEPPPAVVADATPVKEVAGQVSIEVLRGWPREKLLEFAVLHMHAAK